MSPREIHVQDALLRTIAFFDVLDYAPTWSECAAWVEWRTSGFETDAPPSGEELVAARDELLNARRIESGMGRFALVGRLARLLSIAFERMPLQARKLRRARRVAALLAQFLAVRFVALANTTALGNARDRGDLDFFVITSADRIWSTRLLSAGPFRVLGKLSRPNADPDAICLSYFISERALSLDAHVLQPDDPYFRYWFLSLLPLYDDGIGAELWEANPSIRALHPRAPMWHTAETGRMPVKRRNAQASNVSQRFERFARALQMRWFPAPIRARMNADTSVIVSDDALKFHVDDARAAFRDAYEERLQHFGLV